MRFLVAIGALVLFPITALADHITGRFFGTAQWANYTIQVVQRGYAVNGEIYECDRLVMRFSGQSDGGDNAFGQAVDLTTNLPGQFRLSWYQQGMQFAVAMQDGSQYSGSFGHTQSATTCAAAPPPPRHEHATPPRQETTTPPRREASPPQPPRARPERSTTRDAGGAAERAAREQEPPRDTGGGAGGGDQSPPGGGPLPTF